MKTTSIALLAGLSLTVIGQASAQDRTTESTRAERMHIESVYKSAKEACDKLSGNAKDICQAQAKADMRISEADLAAKQKGTPEARSEARNVRADAQYDVAKEKCEDHKGNAKEQCLSEAKAAAARAKADVKS